MYIFNLVDILCFEISRSGMLTFEAVFMESVFVPIEDRGRNNVVRFSCRFLLLIVFAPTPQISWL
jgi:hypothetical protein